MKMVCVSDIKIVSPSRGARSMSWTAGMPEPPTLFSTTKLWPNLWPSCGTMSREMMSGVPPAA